MECVVRIPIKLTLVIATLWSFGLYAGLYDHDYSTLQRIVVTSMLTGLSALVFALYRSDYPDPHIKTSTKTLTSFAAISLALGIFCLPELTSLLSADQLYHALKAQLIPLGIVNKRFLATTIDSFSTASVIQLISLLMLAFFSAYLWWYQKTERWLISFIVMFSALRLLGMHFNASYDPHPPLRLAPIWLSTTILGESALSCRLPEFLTLCALGFALKHITESTLGKLHASLYALAICTIPLVLHIGTLVEQSVFICALFTLLLVHTSQRRPLSAHELTSWCFVIALFTMVRLPAFLGFLYLFGHTALTSNGRKQIVEHAPLLGLSVLLALPFFLQGIINGTPATFTPETADFLDPNMGLLSRVYYAITNEYFITRTLIQFNTAWWCCLFGLLLLKSKQLMVTCLFAALLVIIYFGIHPGLWDFSKYKTEFIVPFMALGLFQLTHLSQQYTASKIISVIVLSGVIVANLLDYPALLTDPKRFADIPLNYGETYQYIAEHQLSASTLVAGVSYGAMNEILEGYTVSDYKKVQAIWEKYSNYNPEDINESTQIEFVVIDRKNKPNLQKDLIKLGWTEGPTFSSARGPELISVLRNK